MARAYSHAHAHEYGHEPHPGEWQALRGELVALLDQVESQVARAARPDPGQAGFSEKMRDLRYQAAAPEDRHREALRTVQRTVDRFSEREARGYGDGPGYPPNPRDNLQSAIQQIRARQAEPPGAPVRARDSAPRFDELAQAVAGVSGRLERLESELKGQARSQTGNIKDIADQVAQLAHVVELLAGAVGETGQVKRLEGQIASLAQLIAQGPQVDLSALTQRLDDVAATVDRLAELQMQAAGPSPAEGMQAIEANVRNIYDRIDAIEKQSGLTPADLEGLTDEMARFTEAMRNPVQPQGLVELIDALNTRIGDLEDGHGEVGGLKADVEALRAAVAEAVEPRFAALETRLDTLSDRMSAPPELPDLGRIEAQVRQLVARMDQTGEQLSGLARLYNERDEPQEAPDYEAIAELVATRASDALAQGAAASAGSVDVAGMAEIESRLSRLLSERDEDANEFDDMQAGIREVNERLARLEASLTAERPQSAPAAEEPPPAPPVAEEPREAPPPPPPAASPPASRSPERPWAQRSDSMPTNPADEAPLNAPRFPDAEPERTAVEGRSGPRKHHPGLEEDVQPPVTNAPPAGAGGPPQFDPATVARPPRPTSSLEAPPEGSVPAVEPAAPEPPQAEAEAPPAASANTFIAAARRAAQRQQQKQKQPQQQSADPEPGGGSLIARAFAGFQAGKSGKQKQKQADAPAGMAGSKNKAAGKRAAKAEPGSATPEPSPQQAVVNAPAAPESFLSRNSKPILLGASVVALCFMTLNLINQRIGEAAATATDETPAQTSAIAPDAPDVTDAVESADAAAPRVIPRVDSLATASIHPAAAKGFQPTTAIPAMPKAFVPTAATVDADETTGALPPLAETLEPLPLALESPVQVEPPPAELGPEALRMAAASGDARAQFEVAAIYTEGRAVPEDLEAAAVWYERAAAQGFAPAQYRLGNLYEHGRGVERDLVQARLWYQRAAEAGNRMSMHNLAALYAGGALGEQKFDIAARWFEQAAARGMKDSQFNLGMLYARGLGVTQDLETSYKWFAVAARSGDADAAQARDDIARSLDADTVSRLQLEVDAWAPATIDMAANFAPIGTWSEDFDPGPEITDRAVIRNVQTALNHLGYDIGTPDGLAGPRTIEAIRDFERATGMSESGAVNPRLLAVLGSQPV